MTWVFAGGYSAQGWIASKKRAALILRDVLAWDAAEVVALLQTSVPAVNSALQRARATLSATRPAESVTAYPRLDDHQRQLLDRFTDAWQRCDIDALAALLREDVILSMPPELTTITGFPSPGLFGRFGLPLTCE